MNDGYAIQKRLPISESTRRRNPQLYKLGIDPVITSVIVDKPAKRLRQSTKPLMNKLEAAWHQQLLSDPYIERIYIQSVKFKLCNGVAYTPDFFTIQIHGHIICYETKGFMRDDASIKIKLAAKEYPRFTWFLVWKTNGEWQKQKILG